MTSYLLTALNVTSKMEGREWRFDGGRFRWVGFESRERHNPTIGESRQNKRGDWEHFEYREGRTSSSRRTSARPVPSGPAGPRDQPLGLRRELAQLAE